MLIMLKRGFLFSKQPIKYGLVFCAILFSLVENSTRLEFQAYTKLSPQWYASLAQEEGQKGHAFLQAGDYPHAYDAFRHAIEYTPVGTMTATWYNGLGLTYWAMQQPALAAASFQSALRLHPSNLVYYQNLIKLYQADTHAPEHLHTLVDYIAYNPVHAEAWFLLGLFYQALDNPAEMSNAWKQHLLLAPRSAFRPKICKESPKACQT
jgi:tetratricopeptide (TPR) repeat protein